MINLYIQNTQVRGYLSNISATNEEIEGFIRSHFPSIDIIEINVYYQSQHLSRIKIREYRFSELDQETEGKEDLPSNLILVNKNNSLPSDYRPKNLIVPNVPFPFEEFQEKKLLESEAALALEKLFEKAEEDEIELFAISGFRSYDRQKSIYESNVAKYGEEVANQFSAKPGESEHQTGLAMDVSSPSVNLSLSEDFGDTKEGKWVKENASKFGFIIRYPKGKEVITGYQYEPWHLRYVDIDSAKDIEEKEITLEEYIDKSN